MSEYQVIARKWRPQRFADVVGQEHVLRTLRNAITSGRTAHAYLFVGSRGIGKTTLSRIFAKALNCANPQNGEPCCQCPSCKAIAEERSLDIIEIDAASRNSVTEMRTLTEEVLTAPVGGKYKIYIIDEVHMLSKQAWNVLLKTVEEPPAHVKFIFATTEAHQVLPTILSRCQRFDLQPIPTRLIAERLQYICQQENIAVSPDAIMAIARAGEGGMRDAQSLLDQVIAFFADDRQSEISASQVSSLFGLTDREDLNKLLFGMLRNQPDEVVTLINRETKKGKNLETLFDDLLAALRAVELCQILRDPGDLIDETDEAIENYKKIAASVKRDTIRILLENLAPIGRILHEALNKQIYLETILLKAMHEAHAVRIEDILDRLNQLRKADELTFVEKLPPVDKTQEIPAIPPAPAKEEKIISQAPVPEPKVVPEVKVETPVSPVAAKEEAPQVVEEVPPAPAVELEDPEPEIEDQVITDEAESGIEAIEPAPQEMVAEETLVIDDQAVAEEAQSTLPEVEDASGEPEAKPKDEEISQVDIGDPLAPAEKAPRESIISKDAKALDKAMQTPDIAEIADLFGAVAVDVHKTVQK